jgi:hypothetical protein
MIFHLFANERNITEVVLKSRPTLRNRMCQFILLQRILRRLLQRRLLPTQRHLHRPEPGPCVRTQLLHLFPQEPASTQLLLLEKRDVQLRRLLCRISVYEQHWILRYSRSLCANAR